MSYANDRTISVAATLDNCNRLATMIVTLGSNVDIHCSKDKIGGLQGKAAKLIDAALDEIDTAASQAPATLFAVPFPIGSFVSMEKLIDGGSGKCEVVGYYSHPTDHDFYMVTQAESVDGLDAPPTRRDLTPGEQKLVTDWDE